MLGRLLQMLDVDRAVFYALLLRVWQLGAGFASVLLIAHFFSLETQGYYYTFSGLIALQMFFELGFNIVVINVASHEWSRLGIDERGQVAGDADARSRLISLGRLLFVWYGVASLLFVAGVGVAGVFFFSQQASTAVSWFWPWCATVLFSGLLLWTLPFNALLEGCNQVAVVNRFRLLQAVTANLAVWTFIVAGVNLWAFAAATAARLACDVYLVCVRYRRFFAPFWRRPRGPQIDWRREVWPMQWRLAVSGMLAYLQYELFTIVMFHYHSPQMAGRMGMTWTILRAVQAASLAWVQTRVPRFGILIAKHEFAELDRQFRRLSLLAVSMMVAGGAAILLLKIALDAFHPPLGERLLPLGPTAIFVGAAILYQFPICQTFYLRAHKREPLVLLHVITHVSIGGLVWLLGSRFGALGAAVGYAAVVGLIVLPLHTALWIWCRRRWHVRPNTG